MKKLKFFIPFVFLCITLSQIQGQVSGCGTQVTADQITSENGLPALTPTVANASVPLLNLEFSVTVYIVRDQDGLPGITSLAIQNAIDRVNAAFSLINLRFRICNTIYIDNYQFNTLSALTNEKDLLIQNYSANTINLYFVSQLTDNSGSEVCGYTFMPSDPRDAVFISKSCAGNNEIVHQFGHFFNLYHTNEVIFGKELVKDLNCNTTGDRCCDTPADPSLTGSVNSKCEYTGSATDDNKQFYIPLTKNYMSLGNDNCRCFFTNDQFSRIIYSVRNQKKRLW